MSYNLALSVSTYVWKYGSDQILSLFLLFYSLESFLLLVFSIDQEAFLFCPVLPWSWERGEKEVGYFAFDTLFPHVCFSFPCQSCVNFVSLDVSGAEAYLQGVGYIWYKEVVFTTSSFIKQKLVHL